MTPAARPAGDELKKSLKDAVALVKDLVSQGKLPKAVIAEAKGLVFLFSTKVGLGVSANGGWGIVIHRLESGSWSPPLPLIISGLGFGAVVGYEEQRTLIGLALQEDLNVFKQASSGGKLGLDMGMTWGNKQKGSELTMTPQQLQAARIFTLSKGVLLDVSLAGNVVDLDLVGLYDCYGSGLPPAAILEGKVLPPPEAQELYEALRAVVDGPADAP